MGVIFSKTIKDIFGFLGGKSIWAYFFLNVRVLYYIFKKMGVKFIIKIKVKVYESNISIKKEEEYIVLYN